ISALRLSLGAEDLSTEGGLEAAIKLCGSKLRSSRVQWQTEFAKWAKCRNDAAAAGRRALASEEATRRCNEASTDYTSAHAPAWKSALDWEKRQHAYDVCLESNPVSTLALAKH